MKAQYTMNWVVTDPDKNQKGRQLSEHVFEFDEMQEIGAGCYQKHDTIDLRDYTLEQIENCINSYGYSLVWTRNGPRNIYELYGNEVSWIIAECLFETEIN